MLQGTRYRLPGNTSSRFLRFMFPIRRNASSSITFAPMGPEKFEMFRNRLTKVYRHIGKQARRQDITCYRIYDHDLPEFALCIERYGDNLYLAEYKRKFEIAEAEHEAWLEEMHCTDL